MEQTLKQTKSKYIFQILKGALLAVIISLIGILFFAFIIKITGLSDGWIMPINQVIKAVSILIGVVLALKKMPERGLIKGLFIGLVYTIIAFFVFSLLNGKFEFDKTILNDVLFGSIMGAICGIICVSIRKRSR